MFSKVKANLYLLSILILLLTTNIECQNWADLDASGNLNFDAFEGGQLAHLYSNVI